MNRQLGISCLVFAALAAVAMGQQAAPDYSALYGSLAQENYIEAKKQADEHMRTAALAERVKLLFCYGRILLG